MASTVRASAHGHAYESCACCPAAARAVRGRAEANGSNGSWRGRERGGEKSVARRTASLAEATEALGYVQ